MTRTLQSVQRVAAQAITGVFRTVALPVAQSEASIEPLHHRWKKQSLNTWISLHTLCRKHPFWKSKQRIDVNNKRFVSPLQTHAQRFQAVDLSRIEEIQPYCIPPWRAGANVKISTREEATEGAIASTTNAKTQTVFTDASSRNGLVGVAVATCAFAYNQTIGSQQDLNVYFAELFAIYQAVKSIERYARDQDMRASEPFVICSDSQAALKSLAKPKQQSGQFIIRSILETIDKLEGAASITFQWVPAHAGVSLNEMANALARTATERERRAEQPFLPRLKTAARRHAEEILTHGKWSRSDQGYFTKQVDQALPGKHTRRLYDQLNKRDASILAQLRTGKCRLNGYLARINAVESEQCDCGRGAETVRHFLFQCAKWNTMREEMKETAPERYGDLAFWLGGWSDLRRPDGKYVDGDKAKWRSNLNAVMATLTFTKATKRLETDQARSNNHDRQI